MTESDNGPGDSPRTVAVEKIERKFNGFLNVDEAIVSYPRFDGTRQTVSRLSVERGDAAAVLMVDRQRSVVWLVEQFRYSAFKNGPGWIVEIPAGVVEPGEEPEETARREIFEEIGISQIPALQPISTFYSSPGITSERTFLFYVAVENVFADLERAKKHRDATEDINVVEWSVAEFVARAISGRLDDAKTLIAGLWLYAHISNKRR